MKEKKNHCLNGTVQQQLFQNLLLQLPALKSTNQNVNILRGGGKGKGKEESFANKNIFVVMTKIRKETDALYKFDKMKHTERF